VNELELKWDISKEKIILFGMHTRKYSFLLKWEYIIILYNIFFKTMYTFFFSVKMPKHVYKPSCTLSKISKVRRRKDMPEISNHFDFTQEGTSDLSEMGVKSVHISNETSNDDESNFIHVHSNELIIVEQDNVDNIENGVYKSPHDESGKIENISDPTVFQFKLASFIVASKIPKLVLPNY